MRFIELWQFDYNVGTSRVKAATTTPTIWARRKEYVIFLKVCKVYTYVVVDCTYIFILKCAHSMSLLRANKIHRHICTHTKAVQIVCEKTKKSKGICILIWCFRQIKLVVLMFYVFCCIDGHWARTLSVKHSQNILWECLLVSKSTILFSEKK